MKPIKNKALRIVGGFLLTRKTIHTIRHILDYWRLVLFWGNPKAKFVIFAQGRTGGTLLVDLLNSHSNIYCGGEIMRMYGKVWSTTVHMRNQATYAWSNGKSVYGYKLKVYELTDIQNVHNPNAYLNKMVKNGWRVIYLKRNNLLRQAISNHIVKARGYFHLRSTTAVEREKRGTITVDCGKLIESIEWRQEKSKHDQAALVGIPHMALEYEKDLLSSETHQDTMDKVFDFIGVRREAIATNLIRTSSDDLEDMIENYDELVGQLKRHSYDHFLDT
jgi:LPS sulfotransferase NodH